MKIKTKIKIGNSLKSYHKTKKRNLKLKAITVVICIIAGILVAGYSATIRIKFNLMTAMASDIDALTEEQANEMYGIKDEAVETATILNTEGGAELSAPEPTVEIDKQIMKEWVLNEVEKAGLSWEEADCLIQNESGWNDWAYNLNKNGSTDFGLWMINSIHKKTISVEDRWDYKKATRWAIEKRLNDGNWNAWYGYINNCI